MVSFLPSHRHPPFLPSSPSLSLRYARIVLLSFIRLLIAASTVTPSNKIPKKQSTQNNSGIQTLLEAEKDASKIVTKARQYRVQRLKDARAEAQKEIEVLKAEKNKEFSGFEQKFSGSNDDSFTKVNAETDQKIVEIDAAYKKNKDLVIERMLAGLVNVEPKVHINVRSA